jgi:hypothetical protein
MRNILALTLIIFMFLISGCAMCQVRTNTFLDKSLGISHIPEGSSFAVVVNKESENPIFDKEVKAKIEYLLKKNGYAVTTPENAEYFIKYGYSIDTGKTVSSTGVRPVFQPGQTTYTTGTANVYGSGGSAQGTYSGTTTSSGTVQYVPIAVSRRDYTRTLFLNVYDGNNYRSNETDNPVWVGNTVSVGTTSDLREMIDYLLIGTFQYFGQDTGKMKKSTFAMNSPEAKELNEAIR